MRRLLFLITIISLSPISFASQIDGLSSAGDRLTSAIENKLAHDPEFNGKVTKDAIVEAALTLRSSALDEVADALGATAAPNPFKCAQLRVAGVFKSGFQAGIGVCSNREKLYLLKYATRNFSSAMPSNTIGLGGGLALTGLVLTASEPEIAGDYACTYKGVAVIAGGMSMECVSATSAQKLELNGFSLGGGGEFTKFEIQIW